MFTISISIPTTSFKRPVFMNAGDTIVKACGYESSRSTGKIIRLGLFQAERACLISLLVNLIFFAFQRVQRDGHVQRRKRSECHANEMIEMKSDIFGKIVESHARSRPPAQKSLRPGSKSFHFALIVSFRQRCASHKFPRSSVAILPLLVRVDNFSFMNKPAYLS